MESLINCRAFSVCVLTTDVIFAADSIPAVFAVTRDRILVLSPELRPRGEIELPEVTSVGHAFGRLVVGHRGGIDLMEGIDTSERSRVAIEQPQHGLAARRSPPFDHEHPTAT